MDSSFDMRQNGYQESFAKGITSVKRDSLIGNVDDKGLKSSFTVKLDSKTKKKTRSLDEIDELKDTVQ